MININNKRWDKITAHDIQKVLSGTDDESFFFEFKSDDEEPNKLVKEISALANTYGGSNGNIHYFWNIYKGNPQVIVSFPSCESVKGSKALNAEPSVFSICFATHVRKRGVSAALQQMGWPSSNKCKNTCSSGNPSPTADCTGRNRCGN